MLRFTIQLQSEERHIDQWYKDSRNTPKQVQLILTRCKGNLTGERQPFKQIVTGAIGTERYKHACKITQTKDFHT